MIELICRRFNTVNVTSSLTTPCGIVLCVCVGVFQSVGAQHGQYPARQRLTTRLCCVLCVCVCVHWGFSICRYATRSMSTPAATTGGIVVCCVCVCVCVCEMCIGGFQSVGAQWSITPAAQPPRPGQYCYCVCYCVHWGFSICRRATRSAMSHASSNHAPVCVCVCIGGFSIQQAHTVNVHASSNHALCGIVCVCVHLGFSVGAQLTVNVIHASSDHAYCVLLVLLCY
jgi:hypothetical protein